jgi:hypothetical protein
MREKAYAEKIIQAKNISGLLNEYKKLIAGIQLKYPSVK